MRVIDSHTEGEPTRLIVSGGPDLGLGPLAERRRIFAERHDHVRGFALDEPRGFDAIVGALLCEPVDPGCVAGLIFFNNVGFLGMCGHATIGAAVTLAHMGRIGPGAHHFETPVGIVGVELRGRNEVTFENVSSHVFLKGLKIEVEGLGTVAGDVAWSGNWFFLIDGAPCPIERANIPELSRAASAVRAELFRAGHRGLNGAEIDHVEFFVRNPPGGADSRNFLLCPGGAYDRSPSGTGTSAKLACLAAEGALEAGAPWIQESVTGGRFLGRYARGAGGAIRPSITGRAWVTAEATLIADPDDPFLARLPFGDDRRR